MQQKLPLIPWYKSSNILYYFIWIFFILYVIGVGVFFIFVQNNSVVYDWFSNPGSPGAYLSSRRGSFLDISVRFLIIIHVIYCPLIATMLLYKKNFGYNIFSMIMFCICILVTLMGLLALSREYANCNAQGEYGNLCNDPNWCNVNEIRINPNNNCPDPSPSPSPALYSSLAPKSDFLGLYWTNFILLLMQITYVIVISIYWSFPLPTEEQKEEEQQEKKKEEEEEEKEEPVKHRIHQPRNVEFIIESNIKTHGIKERKKNSNNKKLK